MRTSITLIFLVIYLASFSQNSQTKILINGKWILTSGQTNRQEVFSSDTLSFVNCNNCEFHDSIHLKPNIYFYEHMWGKTFFELCFNSRFVSKAELSCNDVQYGYWLFNNNKNTLILKFVTEKIRG